MCLYPLPTLALADISAGTRAGIFGEKVDQAKREK
jgi:hypothetical protein